MVFHGRGKILDDLPNHLRRELQKNLENGVLYLSYQFGTFGYMELTGYHIFIVIESDKIRNNIDG